MSLEWATSCPPPLRNFDRIPRIRSERPAFDLHFPEHTPGHSLQHPPSGGAKPLTDELTTQIGVCPRRQRAGEAMAVSKKQVRVGRAYDEPTDQDGTRVLVDRLWPRGLSKAKAGLDEWCKQVAPSTELRRWYGHDPARFAEFRRRYHTELAGAELAAGLAHLRELAGSGTLTLLTASKAVGISEATVLAELIENPSR